MQASESQEDPAPAARRPLLACALALLTGGLAGLWSAESDCAWLAVAVGCAGLKLGAARTGPRAARALLALVLLASLQALRTSALVGPRGDHPWVPRVVEGVWRPLLESADGARGELAGAGSDAPLFELPRGAAWEGERLRLDPGRGPTPAARGPVAAAAPRRGVVRIHADEIVRLAPAPGALGGLRALLLERCDRFANARDVALARALLLGDRARLDPGQVDTFTRTGVRHLLAVSGLHVGLFAALVAWPLAFGLASALPRTRARRGDFARWMVAAVVLVYASLGGGAPPVRRAALAAAAALVAPLIGGPRRRSAGRAPDALTLWGAALVVEQLADPLSITRVGVQLSYTATLGLMLGARPLSSIIAPGGPGRTGEMPAGSARRALRVIGARAKAAAGTALSASVAAAIATLPIIWSRFSEVSPVGVLLTPVALVPLAWLLPAGWIALLMPGPVGALLFEPAAAALWWLVEMADALPATPCPLPLRPTWLVAAGSALTFAALVATGRPRPARGLFRCAALTWAGLLLPWTPAPACLELVALDVGHGTAVALRAPGAGVWIFDAGSRDRPGVARDALAPLLASWDPGRTAVVLSHDQRDHAGALGWLADRHPPWLWAGALPAPLAERLPHRSLRVETVGGIARLPVPGGLQLDLLRGGSGSGNEGSHSLRASWRGHTALLSGDAESEGLRALLALEGLPGHVDLLLLPHHGSHTPWLGPLLRATGPAEVWVSAGTLPPVAAELDRRRLRWRATARDGPLELRWSPLLEADETPGTELATPDPQAGSSPASGRGIDPGGR